MSKADEHIIDEKWLVEQGISKKALATFKRKFLKGVTSVPVSEVLRACEEQKLGACAAWLIKHLPHNPTARTIDRYTDGDIFHDGDIIFNCDVTLSEKDRIFAIGEITVHGELILDDYASVIGRKITAMRVAGFDSSSIKGPVETEKTSLSDYADIKGNIKAAQVVLCRDASIAGRIDTTYLIIGDSAYTRGQVETYLLNMSGYACIYGNVKTQILDISGDAIIFGEVEAFLINGVKPKFNVKGCRTPFKSPTLN